MESMCARCARLTVVSRNAASCRTSVSFRSLSTSRSLLAQDDAGDSGVASAGKSMADAMSGSNPTKPRPRPAEPPRRQPLVRRTETAENSVGLQRPIRIRGAQPAGDAASGPVLQRTTPRSAVQAGRDNQGSDGSNASPKEDRPLIRRTTDPEPGAGQVLRRAGPPQGDRSGQSNQSTGGQRPPGQLIRRTGYQSKPGGAPSSGPGVLVRRTGGAQGDGKTGQFLQRTRSPPGTAARSGAAGRGRPSRPQAPRPDKRRRRAREGEDEEDNSAAVEKQMDEFIAKHVDVPPNPTEALPFKPSKITLDSLRADWPNTAMTTSGMTESVIQKIEWLARRLPHGYQYPEQIAEHYLKGNLTRFESEEEKQTVLKIAAEMSAKTKRESEEGTLHKHESPRFQIVDDPAFTSMSDKSAEKGYLVQTSVKGDYGIIEKQRYPFMQNAARMLNNNGSYGPSQTQKLLDRVQALIPQGRNASAQQVKKA